MSKRILLTGATGFLGSHLAKRLLADDYEIIAIKRNSSSLHRIASFASDIEFLDSESLDFSELFDSAKRIDVIIHAATCYGRNNETASEIFSANTEFPLRLLDAGARAGVKLFINTDTILDKYLNLYALTKNQLLQWGKFFTIHSKLNFINLRLEHFYGPKEDATKFTAYVIKNCLANTPELRLTLGEQKRDFIFIDDVVAAYMRVLEKADSFDNPFVEMDVGSGQALSIREFVGVVHQLTNSNTLLNFGAVPYRDGEVMYSEADTTKLQALGWQCQYDIYQGLNIVVEQERSRI